MHVKKVGVSRKFQRLFQVLESMDAAAALVGQAACDAAVCLHFMYTGARM
jgi:hypothetical protein